jgi:hypothetical protein
MLTVDIIVPNMGAGRCLGPEGNGFSLGDEGEVGPSPPGSRKISSQCSAREEATWRKKKKEERVGL